MKIRSTYHKNQFKYRNEVPEKILLGEFKHLNEDVIDGFLTYKRFWFHLTDFVLFQQHERNTIWEGYCGRYGFNDVVIKVADDCETYQMGTRFDYKKLSNKQSYELSRKIAKQVVV